MYEAEQTTLDDEERYGYERMRGKDEERKNDYEGGPEVEMGRGTKKGRPGLGRRAWKG